MKAGKLGYEVAQAVVNPTNTAKLRKKKPSLRKINKSYILE